MVYEIQYQDSNSSSGEDILFLLKERGKIDAEQKVLDRIEKYSNDPMHFLIIATSDGKPVGYIWIQNYGSHLRVGHSTARLHDVFVLENFRGQGIATELFNRGKRWCNQTGVKYLQWQADKDAVAFYRKLGLEGDTKSDLVEHPFYEIEFNTLND